MTVGLLTACTGQPSIDAGVAGERLIATTPTAWERIYQINTDTIRLSDFVPPGQNAAEWELKLSFESYRLTDLNTDPIELLLAEVKEDERRCAFVQHFNIFSGYENGYETSVRLFQCGENQFAGQGEIKLMKAIRGEEYLYAIRVVKRIPTFNPGGAEFPEDEMADWSQFLNTIYVCNDTAQHPCRLP